MKLEFETQADGRMGFRVEHDGKVVTGTGTVGVDVDWGTALGLDVAEFGNPFQARRPSAELKVVVSNVYDLALRTIPPHQKEG